jgi:IS30 family transposase
MQPIGHTRFYTTLTDATDTDIAAMDATVIQAICAQLNCTPRKCLGVRTPLEVFAEEASRHEE